jgi:hypothetical protein
LGQPPTRITVVAPFPLVLGVLPERELLQIGVGLGEKPDDEQTSPGGVQGGHGLGGRRDGVPRRVDYDDGEAHHVHPHRLQPSRSVPNQS